MAYQPISVGETDDAVVRAEAKDGNKSSTEGPLSTERVPHLSQRPLLSAQHHTPAEAVSILQHWYYHAYRWQAPRVELPPSPLLYRPSSYSAILTDPIALGVTSADIAALQYGVLERLPLSYIPLRYEQLIECREAAVATAERIKACEDREELPLPERINPSLSEEDLKLLDSDLHVSVSERRDIIQSLSLLQKPIYTEMGATPPQVRHQERLEKGVPAEVRGFLNASPTSPGSPTAFETDADVAARQREWENGLKNSFRTARGLDERYRRLMERLTEEKFGLSPLNEGHVALCTAVWEYLHRSVAEVVDAQQSGWLLQRLWRRLCGFSVHHGSKEEVHAASLQLETNFWKDFEKFYTEYRSREGEAARGGSYASRLAVYQQRWQSLLSRYVAAVDAYVAEVGEEKRKLQLWLQDEELTGIEERERPTRLPARLFQLEFREDSDAKKEREEDEEEEEDNNKNNKNKKKKKKKKERPWSREVANPDTTTLQSMRVYPVEVLPLFPSGFDQAYGEDVLQTLIKKYNNNLHNEQEEEEEEEEGDYLGEREEALRQVVLPGGRKVIQEQRKQQPPPPPSSSSSNPNNHNNKESSSALGEPFQGGPHILVNYTDLLLAEPNNRLVHPPPTTSGNNNNDNNDNNDNNGTPIKDGDVLSYIAPSKEVYELLYSDDYNVSSFLFELREMNNNNNNNNNNSVKKEIASTKGSRNASGRYVTYSRVGHRLQLLQSLRRGEAPPYHRYLLEYRDALVDDNNNDNEKDNEKDREEGEGISRKRGREEEGNEV